MARVRRHHRRGEPRRELSHPVRQDHSDGLVRGAGHEDEEQGRLPYDRRGRAQGADAAVLTTSALVDLTRRYLEKAAEVPAPAIRVTAMRMAGRPGVRSEPRIGIGPNTGMHAAIDKKGKAMKQTTIALGLATA